MSDASIITLLWSNHRLLVVEIDGHELRLASPNLRFDNSLVWYKSTNLPVYIDSHHLYIAHECINLGDMRIEIAVEIHGVKKGEFVLDRPTVIRARPSTKTPSTDKDTRAKKTKGMKPKPKPKASFAKFGSEDEGGSDAESTFTYDLREVERACQRHASQQVCHD